MIAGIIWPLAAAIAGVRLSEKVALVKSIIICVIAFVPEVLLIIVFIR